MTRKWNSIAPRRNFTRFSPLVLWSPSRWTMSMQHGPPWKRAEIEFIGPIQRADNTSWNHFRAPDGTVFEIMSRDDEELGVKRFFFDPRFFLNFLLSTFGLRVRVLDRGLRLCFSDHSSPEYLDRLESFPK